MFFKSYTTQNGKSSSTISITSPPPKGFLSLFKGGGVLSFGALPPKRLDSKNLKILSTFNKKINWNTQRFVSMESY